jgi:hypothetical protein
MLLFPFLARHESLLRGLRAKLHVKRAPSALREVAPIGHGLPRRGDPNLRRPEKAPICSSLPLVTVPA